MTSRTQFSQNCKNKRTKGRFHMIVTPYGRNKNLDEEIKNSRTSPDIQFQELSLTKEKTRPRVDYEWIEKTT